MASSAPCGSYTPGPNTNGSVSSSRRSRVAGSSQRDAGTVKPSGSSGVGASLAGAVSVVMIDRAAVGALAFELPLHYGRALALLFDALLELGHVDLRWGHLSCSHARDQGTLRARAAISPMNCADVCYKSR